MVPTVALIWDLARPPAPDALHVTVKGYQWWWGFEYTDAGHEATSVRQADLGRRRAGDPDGPRGLPLARIRRRADRERRPRRERLPGDPLVLGAPLFGKQDVVPGRTNHILFSADEPGVFTGQCAEFCGLQHARMKFRIVALSPADWETWVANEQQGGTDPTDPLALKGQEIFMNPLSDGRGACTACHAIGGTDAGAIAATRPHALRGRHALVLRGVQLGHDRRRGPEGVAPRPERREARCEDAQLQPDRRGDRRPRRLPVQPDVMEANGTTWRA